MSNSAYCLTFTAEAARRRPSGGLDDVSVNHGLKKIQPLLKLLREMGKDLKKTESEILGRALQV